MIFPTDLRKILGLCLGVCLGLSPLRADCLQELDYLSECLALEDQPFLERAHYRYTISGQREMRQMLEKFTVYQTVLLTVMREEGLPDWLSYVPLAESRMAVNAYSKAGAAGLWQLMPATARSLGLRANSRVDERLDVYKSSRAAARYLKQLHVQFDDWLLVLAAYNCGAGNVRKAQRRAGGYFYHEISPYLPSQTRRYIPRVITSTKIAQRPAHYGFQLTLPQNEQLVLMEVTTTVDLATVAEYFQLSVKELKRYNPAYRNGKIVVENDRATLQIPQKGLSNKIAGPWKVATILQEFKPVMQSLFTASPWQNGPFFPRATKDAA